MPEKRKRGRPRKYETVVTIESIDYTMSSTGILTPRAHFTPIQQDGYKLQKVPLYNNCDVGSKIRVYGYKCIGIVEEIPRKPLERCPFCGEPVIQVINQNICTNVRCSELVSKQLSHMLKFLGVPYLMHGGARDLLKQFKTPALYHLFELQYQDYCKLPYIGDEKVVDIIAALNETVYLSMDAFIDLLSIPFMTDLAAADLDIYFDGDIYRFIDAVMKGFDFSHISVNVTDAVNEAIHRWFKNRITSTMRLADCFLFYPSAFEEEEFVGSKVGLFGNTQIFPSYSDARSYVNAIGGKLGQDPEKMYDYYICNYPLYCMGDLKYALDNHIPIMSELEFIQRSRSLIY